MKCIAEEPPETRPSAERIPMGRVVARRDVTKAKKLSKYQNRYPDRVAAVQPVFDRMAEHGVGVETAAKAVGGPAGRIIFGWLYDSAHPQHGELAAAYARAKEMRADALHEKMLQIAETPLNGVVTIQHEGLKPWIERRTEDSLGHRRLVVETYQWVIERMNPKKYGPKVEAVVTGDPAKPAVAAVAVAGLDELRAAFAKHLRCTAEPDSED